jgi:hypothetical protein
MAIACDPPGVSPADTDPKQLVDKKAGETAEFSVTGSGTAISYQWYKCDILT